MKKSKLRLLLNAEPFGYGPAAAIASFFPHLSKRFETIGYMGKGHTLDLQRKLKYDRVHDISGLKAEQEMKKMQGVFRNYDVLLTATDFGVAQAAKDAGLKVIIYDPLTWYWKKIPQAIKKADLYIAQDFIGVRKRLREHPDLFPKWEVVAPITERHVSRKKKRYVLINFGGLQNPYLRKEDLVEYARLIINAVVPFEEKNTAIISTSHAIAKELKEFHPKAYSREEMKSILSQSRYAFMTPGLGNFYEAAAYGIPTVWLPPANDSQGQQAELLKREKLVDTAIDWKDLHEKKIDYFGRQTDILPAIADAVRKMMKNEKLQQQLERKLVVLQKRACFGDSAKISLLQSRFGTGGAVEVAMIVHAHVRRKA